MTTTAALRARATSTTHKLRQYLCPECRRLVKRKSRPKPCCGVKMEFMGSVNETVAVPRREEVRDDNDADRDG